jgi:hypothetical protein
MEYYISILKSNVMHEYRSGARHMKTGGLVNALVEDRLLEEMASGPLVGLMRLSLHPAMPQSFARWLRCRW